MADLSRDRDCGIGELMSAYLDGELRPGELEVVSEHLGDCEDCILEFRQLKEARTAVRLIPMLQVPDRLIPLAHYGEEVSAYLDGELATAEHQILSRHLQTCSECRRELHDLDAARTAVRSLPGLEPPVFLDVEREQRRTRWSPRRSIATAIAGVAAAAVLFGVVGTGPDPQPIDFDAIADRHNSRTSVDAGVSVIPAGFVPAGAP